MHTGMLWFANKEKNLTANITQAVEYYTKKYGRTPDLCLVHPSMLEAQSERQLEVNKITVRPYRPVLPGHIWVGVEDKS